MNPTEKNAECPFCRPDEDRIIFRSEWVKCIWDAYPLNLGHALLVPHRHITSWFDATHEEQVALTAAIAQAKSAIEDRFSPQGYNVGFNDQEAAESQDTRNFSFLNTWGSTLLAFYLG